MLALLLLLSSAALPQDPLAGQLPKRDLGVEAFLQAHPGYDGRGIRVAILDTGIDPGHPLLQRGSTGGRKIVDWYDATTDGRLDTSWTAEARAGTLTGLSGRRLELGRWDAPGRVFRLGRIAGGFLPGGLTGRIAGERRRKWSDAKRRWTEEQARRAAPGAAATDGDPAAELRREEEQRRWSEFKDPGPVYDLVVFRDDAGWRVVVDNDEDGDLGEEPALRPFRESGDWAVLGDEALLNYAVDVSPEGDLTHLFFDAGGHGSHVAGIVAAWGGPEERLNGIAPGAELVAIKIGDGKFGGATSGFSIAKALDYALASGCSVVNISFGGSSFFADGQAPDARAIDEATRRGLIVVTSAGNEGPALTTVGAPGTSSSAFAIAAAVWPDTQRVNYGALDPAGPVVFDFSSRGPLPGGSLGVSFTAPGAALSSLPSWLLTPAENFNGTSMAAPQVAGCVALLLSGARAEGLPADPARVHRALRQGARPLPGFAWVEQGHGAVRVPQAFAALQQLAEGPPETRWQVSVANPFGKGAGVYERDPGTAPFERSVRLQPVFDEEATHAARAAFLRSFRIRSEAAWVQAPPAVYTSASGRSFPLRVDPSAAHPGLNSTRVLLYDADRPRPAGPEIVIPVTLVVPSAVPAGADASLEESFRLDPGSLKRTFVRVPYGAQQVRVTLRQLSGGGRNEFRTGAGSVSGFRWSGERQQRGRYFLEEGQAAEATIPVEAGTVFEFTVASRWAVNRPAELGLALRFEGLVPQHAVLNVPPGQGFAWLAVKSPLRSETVQVKAEISGIALPVDAPLRIVPDPIRPVVFGDRGMFQGVVEWEAEVPPGFEQAGLHTGGSIQTTEYREDLMLEVRDRNDRVVQRKVVSEVDTDLGRLAPGNYRFRLAFPALGRGPLEARYAGAELRLAGAPAGLEVFGSLAAALDGGQPVTSLSVSRGGARTVGVRIPEGRRLPPGAVDYGRVLFQRDGRTLCAVPLRVAPRPGASEELPQAPAEPGAEARRAYQELPAAGTEPGPRLAKARAWAEADPLSPDAELAVLESLAAAGFRAEAGRRALEFLTRFPRERDAFLAAAGAWNP